MRAEFKNIRENILNSINGNNQATLAIVHIVNSNDEASNIYIKNKVKTCESVGIKTEVLYVANDEECTFANIKEILRLLSLRKDIHGIILQLPLPEHLKPYQQELLNSIPYYKDVDGLSADSIAKLWIGDDFCLKPATAMAVLEFLKNKYDLSGKRVAIVNRSALIGKPLIKMLLDENCTVEVMHSQTPKKHLKNVFQEHDIVISGIGNTSLKEYWDEDLGCLWVDCGIIRDNSGKIHGDAGDLKSNKITPVPGGVGILTTACIARNTYEAWKHSQK